jgi:hypothetical protein
MAATLDQLVRVRSLEAEAMLAYLRAMEAELGENQLLQKVGRSLDDLRLPLRVVPHEPIRDIEEVRAREHFRSAGSGADHEGPDRASRRVYRFRGTPGEEEKASRSRPEPLDEVASQVEMAVILGDPGTGKTEWLKHSARLAMQQGRAAVKGFTVQLADLTFPAYLRLRDVAAALADEADLRELLAETGCVPSRPAALTDAERAAAAILKALIVHYRLPRRLAVGVWRKLTAPRQSGPPAPVSLWLDAWAEVRGGQKSLAPCLNAFVQSVHARIFLTSRIIGYDHRPLPVENKPEGHRRELRLCPFEWGDTETFVAAFFRRDPARGQQMLAELRTKIAVAGMAQNPLLATLLCMAFSPSPDHRPLSFPAPRVEVYERVLEGFLGEWEAMRKGERFPEELINAKVKLLEEVAYHFFPNEELTGEGPEDFLWHEKRGYMSKLDDVHPLKQVLRENPATTVVQELCNDGILVPCGGTRSFLFLHLTFQEYLAACYLARRVDDGGWEALTVTVMRNGKLTPVTIRYLAGKRAWLPDWQEVIVFLVGKVSDPKPLLEMLSDPKPPRQDRYGDDVFRHRLALAALCLPEINQAPSTKHLALLVDRITSSAFTLWWEHNTNGTTAAVPHLTRALPALGQVNGQTNGVPLLELLCQRLRDQDARVRAAAARAVGGIGAGAGTAAILARLAELLRDADWPVQSAAARAVGGIGAGAGTAAILARLAELLGDPDWDVHSAAAEAVRGIGAGAGTEAFLARLAELLRDPHWDVRAAAAEAVGGIGAGAATAAILARLAELLRDADGGVREVAAEAVARLASQGVRIFEKRRGKWEARTVGELSG